MKIQVIFSKRVTNYISENIGRTFENCAMMKFQKIWTNASDSLSCSLHRRRRKLNGRSFEKSRKKRRGRAKVRSSDFMALPLEIGIRFYAPGCKCEDSKDSGHQVLRFGWHGSSQPRAATVPKEAIRPVGRRACIAATSTVWECSKWYTIQARTPWSNRIYASFPTCPSSSVATSSSTRIISHRAARHCLPI